MFIKTHERFSSQTYAVDKGACKLHMGEQEVKSNQIAWTPTVGIIILNYNGWKDTLECLASLMKQNYRKFFCVVIDNGSSDDSVERILEWAQDHGYCFDLINDENSFVPKDRHVLVSLGENLGFAKACNLGARISCKMGADFLFFLNNDTVLANDCLRTMVSFLEVNKTYQVVTPKICYLDNPDRVWHCGGRITWYGRRVYYTDDPRKRKHCVDSRGITYFEVSLVSGCALIVRRELMQDGVFFTERFFFGEEDFEFSLRAKKMNIKMACVLDAVVFHKVGGTISRNVTNQEERLGRVYIFYLNRFVDFKHYYRYWWWLLWREVYLFYIVFWLLPIRYKVPIRRGILLARKLRTDSSSLDEVTHDVFEKAIKGEWSS